jgi:hypothetical protein
MGTVTGRPSVELVSILVGQASESYRVSARASARVAAAGTNQREQRDDAP